MTMQNRFQYSVGGDSTSKSPHLIGLNWPYLLCIDGFTKKMFMICNNYMLFFELNIELHLNFDK